MTSKTSLSAKERVALKAAINRHKNRREVIATVTDGRITTASLLSTVDLFEVSRRLNIDVDAVCQQVAAQTFNDDDADPQDTAQDKEETMTQDMTQDTAALSVDIEAETITTKRRIAEALVSDPAVFHETVRNLVKEAHKPAETIVQVVEVEKVVERIVEVSAPPAGSRPAHMPTIIGDVTIEHVALAKYDAPDAPAPDLTYVWPEGTRYALTKVKRGQPVFLFGPAGTGKTSWAREVAARTGRPFVRISFHQDTSGAAIVGGRIPDGTGAFPWTDAVLLRAIRRPGTIVCLDEISAARPDAVMILQAVLEPNGGLTVDETGEHVRVAPGVVFVMCDNTNGRGDTTGQYEGTRRMNAATLDRPTATLKVDYLTPALEMDLLIRRTGIKAEDARRLVDFASLTRQEAGNGTITHGLGLRRLLAMAEGIADGASYRTALRYSVLEGAPHDDLARLTALADVAFPK